MKNKTKVFLSALFGFLFLLLILLLKTVDVAVVEDIGASIGFSHLNRSIHSAIGVHMGWYRLTDFLGIFSILVAALFAGIGGLQLIKRKSFGKVDREILCLGGLFVAAIVLYVFFEIVAVNYRPIIMPGAAEAEASFPSSHTVLVFTIFGGIALVLPKYVQKTTLCKLLQLLCTVLIAVTVIGRFISGVHWFTDILGGVLISLSLLFLFSASVKPKTDVEPDL